MRTTPRRGATASGRRPGGPATGRRNPGGSTRSGAAPPGDSTRGRAAPTGGGTSGKAAPTGDTTSSGEGTHDWAAVPHDHVFVPLALQGVEFRKWAHIVRAFMGGD